LAEYQVKVGVIERAAGFWFVWGGAGCAGAKVGCGWGWGKEVVRDVGKVDGVCGNLKGGWVWVKKESVAGWVGEVVYEAGDYGCQVGGKEEEAFLIISCVDDEAVSMDRVEIALALNFVVLVANDAGFWIVRREVRDLGPAPVDANGAGFLGCVAESIPGFFTEAANEVDAGKFSGIFNLWGTEAKIFLEGGPCVQVMGEGGVVEEGANMVVDDAEYVDERAAAGAKDVRGDPKDAAKGDIFGAVDCRKEEVDMFGPRVAGWRASVGVAGEGMVSGKLIVAEEVPLLKGKGKALIGVEVFVKLVCVVWVCCENKMIIVSPAVALAWVVAAGVAVLNEADAEEEKVVG
jgi:hypothetical protein